MDYKVLKEFVTRGGLTKKPGDTYRATATGAFTKSLLENGYLEVIGPVSGALERGNEEWQPGQNETYYVPGCSISTENDGTETDKGMIRAGLAFKTEEESERMAKWLEAVKVLRRDSERSMRTPTVDLDRYFVWVNQTLGVGCLWGTACWNPFSFSSREDAEKSMEEHREEWLTFFKFMSK